LQEPLLRTTGVLGVGHSVPEQVLTNADFEALVDTSDDWIVSRTGMRERRVVAAGQTTSALAVEAARLALEAAGLEAADLELILVATVTPDSMCPSTASRVQHGLGATRAVGFDVSAACSGFVYALMTGHRLVGSGAYANALVIGAETLSTVTNYEDRDSCVLFGDAAGAVVLGPSQEGSEILDHLLGLDGAGSDLIELPAGRRSMVPGHETPPAPYLTMHGRKVFRFAVRALCDSVRTLAERNGLAVEDLDLIVPHQANLRILEAAASGLGLPMDRFFVNVERYGNTSSASIPLALSEAQAQGAVKRGDLICLVAFGGGLTWGANLLRW